MVETGHTKKFIKIMAGKGYENITIKISTFYASAKFHSAVGVFYHPILVGNYHILHSKVFSLSTLWMVYYLPVLHSV